jgi:hypothetical protein
MKKLLFIIAASIFIGHSSFASGEPVVRETEKGNTVEVILVTEGHISLFSHEHEIIPATVPQDPLEDFTKVYTTYYVSKGEGEMVEVSCSNYKKVLKAHMNDKPEVAEKIGEKGYRMSDLESIVDAYNSR